MRIFENYEKVKYEIIKVIDFLRHAETNLGMLGLWLLCVWCGISGHASNMRCQKVVVLKMCICPQGTPYSESFESCGTKRGVRLC